MKIPRFPPKVGPWDECLPHLPEVDIQPDRVRVKSPWLDIEGQIKIKDDKHCSDNDGEG